MARLLPILRPVGAVLFSAGIIAAFAEGGALPARKPIENGGAAGAGTDASASGGTSDGGAAGSGVGAMGGDTVGGDGGTAADGGSSAGGSTGGDGSGGSAGTGNAGAGGTGNAGSGTGGSGNGGATGGAAGSGNAGSAGTGNAGTGAGGSGGSACEIVKYNFDNCNDGWANSGNADWACGNPTSGPGSDHTSGAGKAWSTSPTGNQSNCTDGSIESPIIDLSSAGGNLRLRYWHWYDFRPCDPNAFPLACNLACAVDQDAYAGGVVEVKNSGGSWVKVSPSGGKKIECYYVDSDGGMTCSPCALDGVTGYAGSSGGWVQQEIDISGYAHSQFQVRFHSASYGSDLCHPNRAGWTVDDVRIAPASCP